MQKRVSLDEIQLARAFAIIAVLLVHSSSSGVTTISTDSLLFPIYNFFNIAGKLGTPTFIFLSSFILFYNYFPKKTDFTLIKNFYVKRLKYILIPYLFFSAVYFILKWFFYYDYPSIGFAIQKFLYLFALGKAHPHLYFVFISVQLYLLFPFFILLFKKFSFLRKHSIWIGILIQWLWVYLNKEYFHITLKGSISLSYFSFYFVGAFLGIYYNDLREKMNESSFRFKVFSSVFFVYGGMVVLYTGYMYLVRIGVYRDVSQHLPQLINQYIGEFTWATHALFAGLSLFLLAHWANKRFSPKTKSIFMEIGATSFGIYLIHPLLLMVMRKVVQGGSPLVYNGWQIFTFITISIGSWLIVRLTQKYFENNYWVIFGKLPSLKQNRTKEDYSSKPSPSYTTNY
ncbi:acyltransferase [Pseudalkalibacillus berkeleyi]|uniref:Acyltransferase n=1 Tax=Pseudalkalibacillus berkeleyi TaxID=1069813 RepID=A0ABS9H491_9BACL|nr:acyltransferase [Pseudalkalibacillus berkeleyi]MCF6138780.1 acyltransferase [Pseudalkalibacillus berkeleyi]